MKKRFGVAAIALASGCAFIFAGCAGCASCGNNGKANEAAFSSNWYADTNFKYIQPTFTEGNDNFKKEEIVYTVKHDKEAASNTSYSVDYSDGEYTTTFYATKFEKSKIDADYREAYPDDITVYCYETKLDVPSVTFTVNGQTSEPYHNTLTTVSYFMDVNNHLKPLYSEQQVDMASPAELQVSSLEEAYITVKQTVKTSYKYDSSAAKTVITEDGKDKTITTEGLDKTDNSLIDVNGLNIAIRAMQLSDSLNQVISVYSTSGKMQSYTYSGSSTGLGEEERKGFEGILEGKQLYVSGEGKSLHTVCVSCTLNASNDMNGVSQKYWFAAIDNVKNNKGRATLVKMSVPLTFNLGTLNYSLKEITSTLY